MSPWLAVLILVGVLAVGAATCLWALLAAASDAVDEWERVRDDDADQ